MSVEPDSGGRITPFPEGRYTLQIIESDVTPNSKNTGEVLKMTCLLYTSPSPRD